MTAGFTDAIQRDVIDNIEAKNEVIIELTHEYTELKFTQMANLKATTRKIEGKTQTVGRATPTERPLQYGKTVKIGKKTRKETKEEYAERMASYGLAHLRLIGDDVRTQQTYVSNFISDILGNFDDLEEELAELKEKVI